MADGVVVVPAEAHPSEENGEEADGDHSDHRSAPTAEAHTGGAFFPQWIRRMRWPDIGGNKADISRRSRGTQSPAPGRDSASPSGNPRPLEHLPSSVTVAEIRNDAVETSTASNTLRRPRSRGPARRRDHAGRTLFPQVNLSGCWPTVRQALFTRNSASPSGTTRTPACLTPTSDVRDPCGGTVMTSGVDDTLSLSRSGASAHLRQNNATQPLVQVALARGSATSGEAFIVAGISFTVVIDQSVTTIHLDGRTNNLQILTTLHAMTDALEVGGSRRDFQNVWGVNLETTGVGNTNDLAAPLMLQPPVDTREFEATEDQARAFRNDNTVGTLLFGLLNGSIAPNDIFGALHMAATKRSLELATRAGAPPAVTYRYWRARPHAMLQGTKLATVNPPVRMAERIILREERWPMPQLEMALRVGVEGLLQMRSRVPRKAGDKILLLKQAAETVDARGELLSALVGEIWWRRAPAPGTEGNAIAAEPGSRGILAIAAEPDSRGILAPREENLGTLDATLEFFGRSVLPKYFEAQAISRVLHPGVIAGMGGSMRVLLRGGASTSEHDITRRNMALHLALSHHQGGVVNALSYDGDFLHEDGEGDSRALSRSSSRTFTAAFLSHVAPLGRWCLEHGRALPRIALDNGPTRMLASLLGHGAWLGLPYDSGRRALQQALPCDFSPVVATELLEFGASASAQNTLSGTCLTPSTTYIRNDMAKLLLRCGAKVDPSKKNGFTLLVTPPAAGELTVVGLLRAQGASAHPPTLRASMRNDANGTNRILLGSRPGTWIRSEEGVTLLHEAVQAGNLQAVDVLLQDGADPDVYDFARRSSLYCAAQLGFPRIVNELLSSGADCLTADENWTSAISIAALGGHKEVVQALLNHGADPNDPNEHGNTALHMASLCGHSDVIEVLLVDEGVQVNEVNFIGESALYRAAHAGHISSVVSLLRGGASASTGFPCCGSLVYFAAERNITLLETLLEEGGSIDARGVLGISPLLRAVKQEDHRVLLVLLEFGASVTQEYDGGNSIMHLVTDCRSATMLMEFDAPTTGRNARGLTPLHIAASAGRADCLREILNCSRAWQDIDARGADGLTALHLAVMQEHIPVIQTLLSRGARASARGYNGRTAMHIAVEHGAIDALNILVQSDVSAMHVEDDNSLTPVVMAIQLSCPVVWRCLTRGDPTLATTWRQPEGVLNGIETFRMVRVSSSGPAFVDAILQCNPHKRSCSAKGPTALHLAAASGSEDFVQALVNDGAFIDALSSQGETALHRAALCGKANNVMALLRSGAAVGTASNTGDTALHNACLACPQTVRALLAFGAPTNCVNRKGYTPLHKAVKSSHRDAVLAILEEREGSSGIFQGDHAKGYTPLHIAAKNNQVDVVQLLLAHGAVIDARDSKGFSPLYAACFNGHIAAALALLSGGALGVTMGKEGLTPLHAACMCGHEGLVKLLLNKGAMPGHCWNAGGVSPLYIAANEGYFDVVKLLLPKLSPRQIDRHGSCGLTPLLLAVEKRHHDAVNAMLEAGADPNEQALDGTQPLSMAAGNWSTKYSGAIVHSLIRAGANPDAFCGKGFLPLHTACTTGGDESIVLALLDGAGTAVDAPCPGAFFNRPLHLAAYHGHADVVRVLASVDGCRLNEKAPHYRKTALSMAVSNGHTEAVRALLEAGAAIEWNVSNTDGASMGSDVDIALGAGHSHICRLLLQAMVFQAQAEKTQP